MKAELPEPSRALNSIKNWKLQKLTKEDRWMVIESNISLWKPCQFDMKAQEVWKTMKTFWNVIHILQMVIGELEGRIKSYCRHDVEL